MPVFKYKKFDKKVPSPQRMTSGAAAFDLCTRMDISDQWGEALIPTGVAIEIPKGYFGMVCLRSSMTKYFRMMDSVGIIDSDYRGEIFLQLEIIKFRPPIKKYDRIAQLIIMKCIDEDLLEVEELSVSARGEKGFGSTEK